MIGIGGSSTLGIGLIIELRDRFTQNANKISASMNQLHGNAQQAMRSSFNMMVGVGAGMTAVGVGITRGMSSAVKAAGEFENVLISLKALSGDMTESQMMSLGNLSKQLGPKWGMNATEVASGMQELVKAGVGFKDIPQVIEAMILTAKGAGEELGGQQGVAARMIDMMIAWKKNAGDASKVGDLFAKTTTQTTINFNDLAESMKYAQSTAIGMGFTLEETLTLIGIIGNAGIKGSMSGVALANSVRELNKAVAQFGSGKKKGLVLQQLGLSPEDFRDAYGNMKRPLEIIEKIQGSLKGMGNMERGTILDTLFGVRGERGMSPLIDLFYKDAKDTSLGMSVKALFETLLKKSAGENLRIATEKMTSMVEQSNRLVATWENFKIAVGEALIPLLKVGLPILNKIMSGLTSFASTGVGKALIVTIAALGFLLIPLGAFVLLTGLAGRGMMALSGGFVAFRTAGLWAWNALIARALTYLGIMGGIKAGQRMNAAGSIIDAATGRIITPAYKVGGLSGVLTKLGPAFTRLLPILGTVARALTGVGLVSLFLAGMGISFKKQVEVAWGTLVWIIGSLANAVMGIVETLTLGIVDFGGGRWAGRQESIGRAAFGNLSPREQGDNGGTQFGTENPYSRSAGYTPRDQGSKDTNVHLYFDGVKTLEKKINANKESELSTKYGLNY